MVFKPNYSTARFERENKKAAKKAAKIEAKKRVKDTLEEPLNSTSDWSVFDNTPKKKAEE